MLRINPKLTFRSGKRYHLHVLGVGGCLGRYDFQSQSEPLTFLLDLINAALHVEICFRHVVVFAFENFLKPAHGLRNWHILAFVYR